MSLYANAAEVLPPELYEEVRNHWNGGILWIPARIPKMKPVPPEDEYAYLLIRAGLPTRDIADSCGMTMDHVKYLAKKLRRKQKTPPPAAGDSDSTVTEKVTEDRRKIDGNAFLDGRNRDNGPGDRK